MKVKAAIATAKEQPLVIQNVEIDEPRPDEVQVRLVATGVCHTDAIVRDQWYPTPLPAVLGHEGAGIVEKVGSAVTGITPGDRVVLSFASCGACAGCNASTTPPTAPTSPCATSVALARTAVRPSVPRTAPPSPPTSSDSPPSPSVTNVAARSVVKVSETTPLDILGPLGCGVLTGAGAVLNVLKPTPGSSFVLFGTGAVGLSGLLAAVAAGATTVIAVDIVDSRLEFTKSVGHAHDQQQERGPGRPHQGNHRRRRGLRTGRDGQQGRLPPDDRLDGPARPRRDRGLGKARYRAARRHRQLDAHRCQRDLRP